MNDVTNRWNNFRIKDASKDTYIWFNDLFNLNLKLKKIKAKCEKYEDDIKSHVFEALTKDYNTMRVSCNVNTSKMEFMDLKKDIHWFWETWLKISKTQ